MIRRIQIAPLVLAVILLLAAGLLHPVLNDLKKTHGLVRADPLINAPPMVAFTTVVLGAFRGIIADVLWLRAGMLQEHGKYFELVQLAEWITTLEPRFPEVWAFHAWNLAYNISVLFDDPADRWRWVRNGVTLLRDRGLRYNPGEAQLYRELGWLFQHKIGGDYDEAHFYYKQAWAREMAGLFDGPQPDYAALEAAQEGSPTYARAQRMKREYMLDPAIMRTLDEQFGPLDWRLPYAHALYWAWRGLPYASGPAYRGDRFERIALTRMIFQSLAATFKGGRLVAAPGRNIWSPGVNVAALPRALAAYQNATREFPDNASFREAYVNFLAEATLTLYICGRLSEARKLYERFCRESDADGPHEDFETFLYHQFVPADLPPSPEQMRELIKQFAYKSAWWGVFGETEQQQGYRALGEYLWRRYLGEHPQTSDATAELELQGLFEQGAAQVESTLRRTASF